jgi:orotidine-5'-phosphate decarboxylase
MRGSTGSNLKILAVTVLTSLDDAAIHAMGYRGTVADLVRARTAMAVDCGCDGIIASPHDRPNEIRRTANAPGLLIATPGVRPAGSVADDHKRFATPAQAIAGGADYLVVGRPIVASPDPAAAACAIIAEMMTAAAN